MDDPHRQIESNDVLPVQERELRIAVSRIGVISTVRLPEFQQRLVPGLHLDMDVRPIRSSLTGQAAFGRLEYPLQTVIVQILYFSPGQAVLDGNVPDFPHRTRRDAGNSCRPTYRTS